MQIEDLLALRSDLSTFIVHLTRDTPDGVSARDKLIGIIENRRIRAFTPYGHAEKAFRKITNAARRTELLDTQRVACFTETPLEHIKLLTRQIEGRDIQFAPYGIAITKRVARRFGVNPVWYLDITPGHDWLTNPLNEMLKRFVADGTECLSPLLRLTPFIEQMGSMQATEAIQHQGEMIVAAQPGFRKEFWWEREWRINGDLPLGRALHFIGLCPEGEIAEFEGRTVAQENWLVDWIDPRWSLERMIAQLAGFPPEDSGIV